MKFGVCTDIGNALLLNSNGYGYFEPALFKIEALSKEAFEDYRNKVAHSSIKPEAFNCFIPGSIKLVGDEVDYDQIGAYLLRAVDRAHQLGASIIVFGSGGARRVPDRFSKDKALEQLVVFLKMVSDTVAAYDITVVIEPLRQQECNIINTVAEGVHLAKQVNRPNIRVLADTYHMAFQKEGVDAIADAGCEYIKHIHIANPEGRRYPKLSDKVDYEELFRVLRSIGYQGRISIEGSSDDLEKDLKEAKEMWDCFNTEKE